MSTWSARPARRALIACGLLAAAIGNGRRAAAAPVAVGLVGPPDDRLMEELGRELVTERFTVVRVQPAAAGAPGDRPVDPLAGVPAELLYGVLVAPDNRRVVVFARLVSGGAIHTRIEMQVDPRDRLARRRACIAVVEYLRVLAGESLQPQVVAIKPDAPESPAPAPAAPRPAPVVAPTPASGVSVLPEAPAPATSGGPGEPALAASADRPASAGGTGSRRWWSMGVSTTLDLSAAFGGGATGHLQFMWRFPLGGGEHLAIRARALWPLAGSRFQSVDAYEFGAAVDLQYSFLEPDAAVRPFLGVSTGASFIVSDSGVLDVPQGDTTLTPTGTLGLLAGLSYRVSPTVAVFLEVEAARDWLIPVVKRAGYEDALANATSLHSSLGALFDY